MKAFFNWVCPDVEAEHEPLPDGVQVPVTLEQSVSVVHSSSSSPQVDMLHAGRILDLELN